MKKIRFVSLGVVLALLLSIVLTIAPVRADGPQDGKDAPVCSDIPGSQIPGPKPGSACRVLVAAIDKGLLLLVYRSGWTHRMTSESDSDLVEDLIKVEADLYYWLNNQWNHDDYCIDQRSLSSHAACRTRAVAFSHWKQNSFHYFQKAGYYPSSFSTSDEWTQ